MPAVVETMAYTGKTPWHGLGDDFTGNLTVEQMLKKAKLNWTVSLRPLAFNTDRTPADGFDANEGLATTDSYRALVRDQDGKVLDVVGSRYLPTQNAEGFKFFKEFVEEGDAHFETAGSLRGGRIVWGLANLNAGFKLAGGDEVRGYLLLALPHEQGKAIVAKFTSIRVVCMNTLMAALRGGADGFRMSHRMIFDASMQENAKVTLGVAREQLDEHKADVTLLSKTRITHDDAVMMITHAISPALWAEGVSIVKERVAAGDAGKNGKKLKMCIEALEHSPGAQLKSAEGTLWGVVNAVSHAVDHQFGRGADQRLSKAWFGSGNVLKQKVMADALKAART